MTQPEQNQPQLLKIAEALQSLADKYTYRKLDFVFPETGPYSRDKYKKHLEFFKAGKSHRFRMLSGGNGTGKSYSGAVEMVYHATGEYPDWWPGKIIKKPSTIWIVAESGALFRDSLQKLLFGNPGEEIGTGLIPQDRVVNTTSNPGIPGGIGSAIIKHKKGHHVSIIVKSFDMRRENLQAANIDLVLFDEEPPEDVYMECIMRLRGTSHKAPGISMLLFTPLKGLSPVVLKYLPQGQFPEHGVIPDEPEKYSCRVTWDDAPHLNEDDKKALLNEIAPNLRDARTKGIPALGSGRIYPVEEDFVIVKPFEIPDYWPRAYALDFGWNCTAALWGAQDPHTKCIYIYAEYYRGQQAPYVHAQNIKAKGDWIPGICDPRGDKSSERDGSKLIDEYTAQGLDLTSGDNSFQSGVARVLNMLESGQLKFVSTCQNLLAEYRIYRYDTMNPNVAAKNQADHLMDDLRYLTSMFEYVAISLFDHETATRAPEATPTNRFRDKLTGY